MNGAPHINAPLEAFTGAVLATTPIWTTALHEFSVGCATLASVCGAIVGVHGVWRIIRRTRHTRHNDHAGRNAK